MFFVRIGLIVNAQSSGLKKRTYNNRTFDKTDPLMTGKGMPLSPPLPVSIPRCAILTSGTAHGIVMHHKYPFVTDIYAE